MRDVADAFARALGHEVRPVAVPREGWHGALVQAGFGPVYAGLLEEMYASINTGHMREEGVPDQRKGVVTIDEAVAAWV